MSVSHLETRQEKENWLIRPLDWAWTVALFATIFGLIGWLTPRDTPNYVLIPSLIFANFVISCLLFWAYRRILNAARGRY